MLHTLRYGDNSMVVHLLTDTMGRQSYMVQGVRSTKGRGSKSALFQPLFAIEFVGTSRSQGDMHRFKEVASGIVLRRTPFDIRRSTVSLFCAEVIYRLVKDGESNTPLFEFVWSSIELLDLIDDGVANFHLWFLANLSRHLGFMPAGEWREGAWFDISAGEYSSVKPLHGNYLEPRESALLNHLLRCNISELGGVELNRERRVLMLESLLHYYSFHLDTIYNVQSLTILKEIF